MPSLSRERRHQLSRHASDLRLRCMREGLTPDRIVDVIRENVPEVFALEAWRFAHGWSRTEVSARLDALYEADGLAGPHVTSAELCRWEHEQRRPSDERIEYLCRLYGTRPDRLGFGIDYSGTDINHLSQAGLSNLWPRTNPEVLEDLVARVKGAQDDISVFGLTRNFYAKDELLPLFESKAIDVPVTLYVMDPRCASSGLRQSSMIMRWGRRSARRLALVTGIW